MPASTLGRPPRVQLTCAVSPDTMCVALELCVVKEAVRAPLEWVDARTRRAIDEVMDYAEAEITASPQYDEVTGPVQVLRFLNYSWHHNHDPALSAR